MYNSTFYEDYEKSKRFAMMHNTIPKEKFIIQNRRFSFRIPLLHKDYRSFVEFLYSNAGEDILIPSDCIAGEPQQCLDLEDKTHTLIYEGDIVQSSWGRFVIKYCEKCKQFQLFTFYKQDGWICFACIGDAQWSEFIEDLKNIEVIGNISEDLNLAEILED